LSLQINFETTSSEFSENGVAEVVSLLREVQADIILGHESGLLYDSDRTVIGSWSVSIPQKK
jgi:hypothetical protein